MYNRLRNEESKRQESNLDATAIFWLGDNLDLRQIVSMELKRKEKRKENIAGLESLGPEQQMNVLGQKEGRYVDKPMISHH